MRKPPNNRMLLITEARKQLKQIVTDSMSIPPDHVLIFTHVLATPMPLAIPDNITHTLPHINFGHYKLRKQDAQRTLDDEEQLYWMTT